MASSPAFTAPELDTMRSLVDDRDWLEKLPTEIASRPLGSLRSKMTRLRQEVGIAMPRGPRPGCDNDDWQADARAASMQLCEATLRVGRWS